MSSSKFGFHLVFTCLVTNVTRDGKIRPGNRLLQLFETLESLRYLKPDSAEFHISFGADVKFDEEKLRSTLAQICPNYEYQDSRLETFQDWQEVAKQVSKNNVEALLLLSYEDHKFIQTGIDEFNHLKTLITELNSHSSTEKYISVLSHFPEAQIQANFWLMLDVLQDVSDRKSYPLPTPIGVFLTTPKIFQAMFASDFTNGSKIVSTENYFGPSVSRGDLCNVVPRTEIFRHLDGYAHVGLPLQPHDGNSSNDILKLLVGRSLSYQAIRRCNPSASILEISTSLAVRLDWMKRTMTTCRSISLWLFGIPFRLIKIEPVIRKLRDSKPQMIHILNVSASHGIIRFLLKELSFNVNKMRAR